MIEEQPPAFVDGDAAARTVDENTPAGQDIGQPVRALGHLVTYELSGEDADAFDIVADTGQLRTKEALDFEQQSEYAMTVTATTGSGLASSLPVTIGVTNLDEPGTLTVAPGIPMVSEQLAASLSDPDGEATDVSWSWEKSPDATVWTLIDGATDARYTPVADDAGHYLRVTARYTDPLGPEKQVVWQSEPPVAALPVEPGFVGRVNDLEATAQVQPGGSVRLSWTPAQNAQTRFVVYIKSSDVLADNYHTARMMPFSGSQGVITGLEVAESYHFIVIGMRWNWVEATPQ